MQEYIVLDFYKFINTYDNLIRNIERKIYNK